MPKRRITVTVDEELVETIRALGADSLSAVVNRALDREVGPASRHASLGRLLAAWDTELGPVEDGKLAWAAAEHDAVDGFGLASEAEVPSNRSPE